MQKEDYFSTYGGQVLRNYKIADYLVTSTQKKDKVFIWGDGVPIYALSRRLPPTKYVADYHIKDFSSKEETLLMLGLKMPKMIVILPDSEPFPELLLFLRKNYILVDNIDSAQIWTVLSPRVRALIAT